MEIYHLVISFCVLSSYAVSSDTARKCDITIWHMGVVEYLLTQETEMTQRQKSTLEKAEQMIQRIIKNGGSPLVNCGLLNTYSYNLVPEFSSQLMDLTIRETEEKNDRPVQLLKEQSSDDLKVASGGDDDGYLGQVHSSADKSTEKDNKHTKDDAENKRSIDKKLDEQLGTDDSNDNISNDGQEVPDVKNDDVFHDKHDITEGGADKTIVDDKGDVTSEDAVREPNGGTGKGDSEDNDNREHREHDTNTAHRNSNGELSDGVSKDNNGNDRTELNDPDNGTGGGRDDEGSDSKNKNNKGTDSRSSDDTKEVNDDDKNSNPNNNNSDDINTEEDVNISNIKVTDTKDKSKEKDDATPSDEGSSSHNMNSDVNNNKGIGEDIGKPEEDDDNKEGRGNLKDHARNINNDNGLRTNKNEDRSTKNYGGRSNYGDDNNENNVRSDIDLNMKTNGVITNVRKDIQDQNVINDNALKKSDSPNSKLDYGDKMDKHKMWELETDDTDESEEEDCYYSSAKEFVCTRKSRHSSNGNEINKNVEENMKRVDEDSDENQPEYVDANEEIKKYDDTHEADSEYVDRGDQLMGYHDDDGDGHARADKDETPDKSTSATTILSADNNHEPKEESTDGDENMSRFNENMKVVKKEDLNNDEPKDNAIDRDGGNGENADTKLKRSHLNDNIKSGGDQTDVEQKDVGDVAGNYQEIKPLLSSDERDMAGNGNINEDDYFVGRVPTVKGKNTKGDLDQDSKEFSTESLTPQQVSREVVDKSGHVDNSITKRNDNADGVLIFYDVDDDDDSEDEGEIKMYDSQSHETTSNGNNDIESIKEHGTGNQESISLESANEFSGKLEKLKNNVNDISSEKTAPQERKTVEDKNTAVLNDKDRHSTLDMKQWELIFAQRESEQAAKIQNLELMLVKLENRVLTQSAIKQTDSSVLMSLENHILKMENELMKLSHNYQQLLKDHDALKSQQRKSYLELEHIKTSPRKPEYPALEDNITIEMVKQQKTRIVELSKLIHNQSVTAQMLQSRSLYLEEENRRLFQIVLNQTAVISSIMRQLDELGKEGLETRKQAEDFKAQLEHLKQADSLQRSIQKVQSSLKQSESLVPDTRPYQASQGRLEDLEKDTKADQASLKHQESLQQEMQIDQTLLKQSENLKDKRTDQISRNVATSEHDFGRDSSVKTTPPVQAKDLMSIVLFNFRKSPTADSPSALFDIKWRCAGQNSTRLCFFHSLIISNCTPFSDLQWRTCKQAPGSLLLELSHENDLKHKESVKVHLPSEHQTPVGKYPETLRVEKSKIRDPLGGNPNVDDGMQNSESDSGVVPSVATMLDGNNQRKSTALNLEEDNSKTSSESEKPLTVTSTPSGELPREDTRRDQMGASMEDISDLLNKDRAIDNTVEKDEARRRGIKTTANNRHEDDIINDSIKFKSGDSHDFEKESRNKHSVESNIPMDIINKSAQDLPHQTEHHATPTGAESPTTSPCGHNAQSPECSSSSVQARKSASDTRTVQPELNEQGQIQDSNVAGKEDDKNSVHSTTGNDVQVAQGKLFDDRMRKRAAEEAKKTHEALYRKILYLPIYDDRPKDCYELHKKGREYDGLGQIFVGGINVYVTVYCDITNGGWTLLLKREDGLVDFYRDYEEYKDGFGAPTGEHYIGNEVIHHLTNQGHYSLKVDLSDWAGTTRHAHYDHFWVDGEEDDFRLHLSGYSGNAGDGLSKHSGMKFSTFDLDNDLMKTEMGGSCAKRFHGAGWYYKCYSSNLMGRYYTGGQIPDKQFDGVAWKPWHGPGYSLKTVVLAVRPVGAE